MASKIFMIFVNFSDNYFKNKFFNDFWLGYKKIAESSKPTAASFSFGKRHTHISRDDTVGPGPAEYDVSGLGSKGTRQSIDQFENKKNIIHLKNPIRKSYSSWNNSGI